MSFISSATTITLTAYLSNKGRNFLVSGTKQDIEITKFVLGDSDTDYNLSSQSTPNLLLSGEVPGVTGDNTDCVKSISNEVDIRYKIKVL